MQTHLQILINDLVDGFPTLPAVVSRVMAITADPDSSTKDLYRVIQADQALTVNVLKMANSVFYGLPKRVESLQHALSILGYVEVRNLVIMQAVFKSFKVLGGQGPMDIRPFWQHALDAALAAELIGRGPAAGDQDFYVAGLVHDIGKLVIYMALPEAYAEMVKEVGPYDPAMFAMEQRFFGITHEETAQRVLRQWMFPESILEAVACHHRPETAADHPAAVWVVHAADLLVRWADALDHGAETEAAALGRRLLAPALVNALKSWGPGTLDTLRGQLAAKKAQQSDLMTMFTA